MKKSRHNGFNSDSREPAVGISVSNFKSESYSSDPYQIIDQFFLDGTIKDGRDDLSRLFEAAFPDELVSKRHYPSLLISIFGRIDKLIDAAFTISLESKIREEESKREMDRQIMERFKLLYKKVKDWSFFPNKLSPNEWINPRITIRDFFEYQPISHWKGKLHEFLLASVRDESICYLISDRSRLYLDCEYLERLIEAMWLIKVLEF